MFTPPFNMTTEECGDLLAFKGADANGRPVIVSCFQLSAEELQDVVNTGKLWLWVHGDTQPPVSIDTKNPWRTE